MSSRDKKLKPPSEIEASLKISIDGEKEKKSEEQNKPVNVKTKESKIIQVQKVAQQGKNKSVATGKRFEVLQVREDGFLQSLIIAWNGSAIVNSINIQLDLGKHGSFHVDFLEYFDAGIILAHSAQDFWVSKKDDTNKKYAVALTPAIPIEFNGLKVTLTNSNAAALTIGLAQLKFYQELVE